MKKNKEQGLELNLGEEKQANDKPESASSTSSKLTKKERSEIKEYCKKYNIKSELEKGLVLELFCISKLDNSGQGDIKFSTYMIRQYGQVAVTSALESYYRQKSGKIKKHGGYLRTAAQVAKWSIKKAESDTAATVPAANCENCKKVDKAVVNKFDKFEDDSNGVVVDYLQKKKGAVGEKSVAIGDNEVKLDYVKTFLNYACCQKVELTNSDNYKISFEQKNGRWYNG